MNALPDQQPVAEAEALDHENPWPGLEAYQERDQAYFQGRTREAQRLYRLVSRSRLAVLYGPPGFGKTSLLRAGLFWRLRCDDVFPIYVRLEHRDDGNDLTAQVCETIVREAALAEPPIEVPDPSGAGASLWEYFHRRNAFFWNRSSLLVTPLLVFDQFEEIFTHGRSNATRISRSEALLADLAALIDGKPPAAVRPRLEASPELKARLSFEQRPLKILLCLREDFLPDLEGLRESLPDIVHNRMRLQPMNGEQAQDVLAVGGHLLEGGSEGPLARRIILLVAGALAESEDAVGMGAPGRLSDLPLKELVVEPALLSLVCRELNDQRLQSKARQITHPQVEGNREKIFATFYERCLGEVPEEVRPAVREFIEERLLTRSGFRDSVALEAAPDDPSFVQALQLLQERRLLRIERRGRLDRVELTHDVLTGVVRDSREARKQQLAADEQAQQALRMAQEAARQAEQALREWREQAEKEIQQERLRRSRKLNTWLAICVILATAGGVWGFLGQQRAGRAQADAQNQAAAAVRALVEADVRGAILVADGRAGEGLAYLARAARLAPTHQAVRSMILELLLRRSWPLPTALLRHDRDVYQARFSPDGRWILTASEDGTAALWEAASGRRLHRLTGHDSLVLGGDFSPDGKLLVTASGDGNVRLWETGTGKLLRVLSHGGTALAAWFSPNGQLLLTASNDGTARLWTVRTGAPGPIISHGSLIHAAQFSPDGLYVATASNDNAARLWSTRTGKAVGRRMRHRDPVFWVQFDPGGRFLVTASVDRSARLWRSPGGEPYGKAMEHEAPVRFASFSPDGKIVATASWDGTARLWGGHTGDPMGRPMRHDGRVQWLQFSPDGLLLMTASSDGTARLWDVPTGRSRAEPLRHGGLVYMAQLSPEGRRAVTASADGTARIWNVESGRMMDAPLQHQGPVGAAQFADGGRILVTVLEDGTVHSWDARRNSPLGPASRQDRGAVMVHLGADGARLVTVNAEGTVRLWSTATGEALGRPVRLPPPAAGDRLRSWLAPVDLAPDGRRLATAFRDGRVRVWELERGDLLFSFKAADSAVRSVRFSADGRWLVTGSADRTARVWDARSGAPAVGRPMRHQGPVNSARFSDDGLRVVTGSADRTARVWDALTGEALSSPMRHEWEVAGAAFSPDGKRVVTAAADAQDGSRTGAAPDSYTVRLWDAETGQLISEAFKHQGPVRTARFSPDGQRLTTASLDGTARIWDVPTGSPEERAVKLLAGVAEAVGGYRLNERGVSVSLPDTLKELEELRTRVIRAPGADPVLRWFFADRATRTISPFSTMTVPDYIRERLSEDSPAARAEAARVYPGHPLLVEQPSRPR